MGTGREQGDMENVGHCWDRTLAPLMHRPTGGGMRALPPPPPPSWELRCCSPEAGGSSPRKGLQLAGASGDAAVWLLFCFREDAVID